MFIPVYYRLKHNPGLIPRDEWIFFARALYFRLTFESDLVRIGEAYTRASVDGEHLAPTRQGAVADGDIQHKTDAI